MKHFLLVFGFLISLASARGQNTMVTLGNGGMQGTCTQRTADRGFVFGAYDYYSGQKMVFMKTDSLYNTLWAFSTPEPVPYNYQYLPFVMEELSDGSIIVLVAGSSTVMKISPTGGLIWRREYCDLSLSTYFYNSYFYDMTIDHRGQILLVGDCLPQPASQGKLNVIQAIDTSGVVTWRKEYKCSTWEGLSQIVNADDGGFTAIGLTASPGTHAFLIHIDSVGNALWTTRYPVPDFEYLTLYEMIQGKDGSYVTVGRTAVLGPGVAMKFDSNGNYLWSRTYGDSTSTWFFDVIETESEYVICGSSSPAPNCGYHGLLMGLNKNTGNKNWQSVMGDPLNWTTYHTMLYYVEEIPGGYLAGGYSDLMYQPATLPFDAALFYTNGAGQIPCWNYTHPLPLVPHAPLVAVQPNMVVASGNYYATWITPVSTPVTSTLGYACPVGIEEEAADEELFVFPNPAADVVTLSNCKSGETAKLYSASGQLVNEYPLRAGRNTIDVSSQSAGLYLLSVSDGEGTVRNHQLIIE